MTTWLRYRKVSPSVIISTEQVTLMMSSDIVGLDEKELTERLSFNGQTLEEWYWIVCQFSILLLTACAI